MATTHAGCKRTFEASPHQQRIAAREAFWPPLVDLAEKVGRFEPPFELFQRRRAAFSAEKRFLLDRKLAGDPLAERAFEAELTMARWKRFSEAHAFPEEADRAWRTFVETRQPEWASFLSTWNPWNAASVVTLEDYSPDPNVDAMLDRAVLDNLGGQGFKRRHRSFRNDSLSHPLILNWDKGSWRRSTTFTFTIPCYGLDFSPATAFFLSRLDIDHSRLADPGPRFTEAFAAIGQVFPVFLDAIRLGLQTAEDAFKAGAAS